MFGHETTVCTTQLIKDDACYFGIFDYSSPANGPAQWETLFQAARSEAGRQAWQTLLHFNQSWIELARESALLSWITLFGGVFKVEVRLLSENPQVQLGESETNQFLGEGNENQLYCPSGKIAVASLTQLGLDSIAPLITVMPGAYKVGLHRNEDEESKHQFLEDEAQYPANEGPDWIISMQRTG